MKRKARYNADGHPAQKRGRETYTTVHTNESGIFEKVRRLICKQNVEYAGYRRGILRRNPVRQDEDGDVIDREDEDEEADVRAAEDNPYAGIHLESGSTKVPVLQRGADELYNQPFWHH